MPKKSSPQSILKTQIIRTYRERFNSNTELANALGIPKDDARAMLQRIAEGKNPVSNSDEASQYLRALSDAPSFLEGSMVMEQVYRKEGKNYIIEDYKIEPGAALPSTPTTENPYAYQVIIEGKMGGKTRKITTTYAGDPQSALDAARAEMSRYYKFSGTNYTLRVLSDNEGYEE